MEQTIVSPKAGTVIREIGDIAPRAKPLAIFRSFDTVRNNIRGWYWRIAGNAGAGLDVPLDIERISARLSVLKRAEEDARRNLPPSGEEVPGGMQREIINYFVDLRRRARKRVAADAGKTRQALEGIDVADALARIRDLPADCENRILRRIADSESRLKHTAERELNQKKHYDSFRTRNGLDRVADYPGAAFSSYLVVPLLFVLAAVGLAQTVEAYPAGNAGVSTAWIAAVSAAVIIVPFLLGEFLLRSINHINILRKVLGWIGAIAALAATLVMALYADFHIAAVAADPDTSTRMVLDALRAEPLGAISAVASWKIVGLVALAGLLAMLLAYRSDDPYPGYGQAQRAYYAARGARELAAARLRNRINGLIDASAAEIAAINKDFRTKVRTYASLLEKSERNPFLAGEYDAELEDACNRVLERYRAANAAARQSATPISFGEHVCFSQERASDAALNSSDRSHLAELQAAVVELEKESDLARQKLRTLNLQMINTVSEPWPTEVDPAA